MRPPRSVERIEPSLLLERLATSASKTLGRASRVVVRMQHVCPACFADPGALCVLLTKLIAKVAGDMPGGGVIALSARPASDGSLCVEFVVRDEDHCSAFSARIVDPAFAAV